MKEQYYINDTKTKLIMLKNDDVFHITLSKENGLKMISGTMKYFLKGL